MNDTTTSTAELRDTGNTSRKRGRQPVNGVAMTPAERKRKQRERQAPERAAAAVARLDAAIREAQEVLAQLRAMRPAAAPVEEPAALPETTTALRTEPAPEPVQAVQPEPLVPTWDPPEEAVLMGDILGKPAVTWNEQEQAAYEAPLHAWYELTRAQILRLSDSLKAHPEKQHRDLAAILEGRHQILNEAAEEWAPNEVARAFGEVLGNPAESWGNDEIESWFEPLGAGLPELTLAQVRCIGEYLKARPNSVYGVLWRDLEHRHELAQEAAEWAKEQYE